MTGEITKVGFTCRGIKEKILCKRAKINEVIPPLVNDVNEINESYIKGLKFHYVNEMSEVIELALTDKLVKNQKL